MRKLIKSTGTTIVASCISTLGLIGYDLWILVQIIMILVMLTIAIIFTSILLPVVFLTAGTIKAKEKVQEIDEWAHCHIQSIKSKTE